MFGGGSSNAYDEIVGPCHNFANQSQIFDLPFHVAKTTDENLTAENWELILNLCDKIQDEASSPSSTFLEVLVSKTDQTTIGFLQFRILFQFFMQHVDYVFRPSIFPSH